MPRAPPRPARSARQRGARPNEAPAEEAGCAARLKDALEPQVPRSRRPRAPLSPPAASAEATQDPSGPPRTRLSAPAAASTPAHPLPQVRPPCQCARVTATRLAPYPGRLGTVGAVGRGGGGSRAGIGDPARWGLWDPAAGRGRGGCGPGTQDGGGCGTRGREHGGEWGARAERGPGAAEAMGARFGSPRWIPLTLRPLCRPCPGQSRQLAGGESQLADREFLSCSSEIGVGPLGSRGRGETSG